VDDGRPQPFPFVHRPPLGRKHTHTRTHKTEGTRAEQSTRYYIQQRHKHTCQRVLCSHSRMDGLRVAATAATLSNAATLQRARL